jgi:membrane-bound serine protease (ClpP class)
LRNRSKVHDHRGLRRCATAAAGLLLVAFAATGGEPPEPDGGQGAPVVRLRIDSIIHPIAAQFLARAIEEAEERDAQVLVVELATPGGLLESTRQMFTAMLGTDVPVVVYVAPSGAQAASAGFFLLMAADVAAMAPGTNAGAAHPVGGQGEEIEGAMGDKVEQDAAATIRSLAARNGRNAELAEAAVLESRSFTAGEALEAGLVDLVAPSFQALLLELDGRSIDKREVGHRLATAGAEVFTVEMGVFQRVLSALAHPNLAYILLSLGFLGLYFELMNPGSILPGVVGALCLLLALPALAVLPFNYAGIALIVLAVLLFVVEIKVTSYGLLTLGGLLALALGGLMLFDSPLPALRVSLELIAGVALFAAVVVTALLRLAWRAQHDRVRTGKEGLVGEVGRASSHLGPAGLERPGKVFVHGEIWSAVSASAVAPGTPVEVVAVRGLLLEVRPLAVPGAGRTEDVTTAPGAGAPGVGDGAFEDP